MPLELLDSLVTIVPYGVRDEKLKLDILPIYGRIRHPQAQCKIEHFYRTMNQELL